MKRTIDRSTKGNEAAVIEVFDIGTYVYVEDETQPCGPTDWGGYAFIVNNVVAGVYTVSYILDKNKTAVVARDRCKLSTFSSDRNILRPRKKGDKAKVVMKKKVPNDSITNFKNSFNLYMAIFVSSVSCSFPVPPKHYIKLSKHHPLQFFYLLL